MSIIYVHGVNTRETQMPAVLVAMLRRHVASSMSAAPDDVPFEYAYWGDVAAKFAWDGASRPRTPITGMGMDPENPKDRLTLAASEPGALEGLPSNPAARSAGGLAPAGPDAVSGSTRPVRLKDLSPAELADLLATVLTAQAPDGADAATFMALDDIAHDPATQRMLGEAEHIDAEWNALSAVLRTRLQQQAGVAGMGLDWLEAFGSRLKEALGRGSSMPSYVLGRAVAEFRKPMNEFISVFLGDVFEYLKERGTAEKPGAIQQRLLQALERAHARKRDAGEPIVVLSHSMGGQLVYDAVTHFLPAHPQRRTIKIDFWCATASQVALFEELKLFIGASDDIRKPDRVPFPTNLGHWWNVWDHNDFISFTGESIFGGIDDEPYDSGMGLLSAHGGYLERPSFFRKLGRKVADALEASP